MLDVLLRDGLSLDLLEKLSYRSELGLSLKHSLRHFDKEKVIGEITHMSGFYDEQDDLRMLALDYRVKSIQSALMKYERYYPNRQMMKVFDDILGFRSMVDDYESILACQNIPQLRTVDMSHGKATDDGYRGVHVYYQVDNFHYPIEIQYNTHYDRYLNDWLHKYVYKKGYPAEVGSNLRAMYERGLFLKETEFKEALENHVLYCGERR